MSYILEKSVIDEAYKHFKPDEAEKVIDLLQSTSLPMERSAPPPRVHVAVIWLSKGDMAKFIQELENASCDWRDTLLNAGLGNEDWNEILNNNGVSTSDWA